MKVRILQCMRGPKLSLDIGDIHEGPDAELARWCAHGIAEPIPEKRETPESPAAPLRKKRKAQLE
jgi:hypothetical protein